MVRKQSPVDSVPDFSPNGCASIDTCFSDPDMFNSEEEVEVDLYRSENGSKSNLARAETNNKITSHARVKKKHSVAKTGNETSDGKTGKQTNDAKNQGKPSVVNPTASTSGLRARLTGGKAKHKN
jgi:hypothetical protein